MKKILIILCLSFGIVQTNAQNITAAEYFIDTDPGAGFGIPISIGTPGTTVNFTASIPTASLSNGFHTLAIRTKDASDMWGLFETRGFYISSASIEATDIAAAEYFIDADPGAGAGNPVTVGTAGNTVNFTAIISTTALSAGFHTLAIRTRNTNGEWGLFEARAFYISTSTADASSITAAEFFIDADPGPGNGTSVSIGATGNTVNFTALIPTTSLPNGFHTLAIRTKNADGQWGLFEARAFYISTQTADMSIITAAEYFIDTDPGVGNGSSLSVTVPGNIINQTFLANVPAGTAAGQHLLAIRTRDANGVWSLFEASEFTVGGILPLNWISFTGKRVNETVNLKWITENEVNTSHFIIERSANSIDFSSVGNISAAGNARNEYVFDDRAPLNGFNFYRLKQVDRDGSFEYSTIVKVYFGSNNNNTLRLYPNPSRSNLNIEFAGRERNVTVQVYDATGKMVINNRMPNQNVLSLSTTSLIQGTYWIVVSDGITNQKGQFVKSE